jgi:hypothetical protein
MKLNPILVAIACAALLVAWLGIWLRAHPCVKTRYYKCQVENCLVYQSIGDVMVCVNYETVRTTCSECLERK